LTDVDLSNGVSLQTYWKDRELMSQILISHLEWLEKERGPIGLIVDALSELSYQETINWPLIDRRWNVLHRVFESSAGRALGNLGYWIQDVIRDPACFDTYGKWLPMGNKAAVDRLDDPSGSKVVAVQESRRVGAAEVTELDGAGGGS
jgi:hypothetical protein